MCCRSAPWVSLAIVIVLAVLTFVPTRYLYPSQPGRFNRLATILGIPWAILCRLDDLEPARGGDSKIDATPMFLAWISLVYPVFYLGVSWAISVKHWRKQGVAEAL